MDHRMLLENLMVGVRQKSALIRDVLNRPDLDFMFAVYGEPHKAGHFLWKYMDEAHPDHIPTPDLNNALRKIYQLIDRELAALTDMLGEDDNLLVFSDHGMQANYRGEHMVELILERLGLGGPTTNARQNSTTTTGSAQPIQNISRAVRGTLHRWLRRFAPAKFTRKLRDRFGVSTRVRWGEVRAFPLPTDRNSYIRINLRGREPDGTVSAGGEHQQLVAMLEREFRALVNAETGKLAVEEVFRPQDVYPGPHSNELPDLAILWSSESPVNVLQSPSMGRLEARFVEQRSGNHRPEGFLLARGPRFKSGQRIIQGDVLQIAPTLLALHGVPLPPEYAEGPIGELFVHSVHGPIHSEPALL
jgi:predicted AlkP superfamily phosphohydrolase/phosphomutase